MSTGEEERDTSVSVSDQPADEPSRSRAEKPSAKLELDVQIKDVGPCKKHLKVTIPRAEIERQFEDSLGTFQREAQVPGFRPGRAPRQLVEKRFRKQVAEQVKSLAADGLARADRRGLQAQSDHPAASSTSRRSSSPTTGR